MFLQLFSPLTTLSWIPNPFQHPVNYLVRCSSVPPQVSPRPVDTPEPVAQLWLHTAVAVANPWVPRPPGRSCKEPSAGLLWAEENTRKQPPVFESTGGFQTVSNSSGLPKKKLLEGPGISKHTRWRCHRP